MTETTPTLLWFRRDLRLGDHPALSAAIARGGPVVALFIRDAQVDGLGAAARLRLELSLEHLSAAIAKKGGRLILRSGPAREVLEALLSETGARAVHWTRGYDPETQERDSRIKAGLKEAGIEARSFGGNLLFEPWTVETRQGNFYKVYSPFWRAVKDREVEEPLSPPGTWPAPPDWPESERLSDWALSRDMRRGREIVASHARPGEEAASARLAGFMRHGVEDYGDARNMVAEDGTSKLSEHLTLGEISPHRCWHAGLRAREAGKAGAESFLRELAWREFGYHLLYHTPRILTENWREGWDGFPWREDERLAEVRRWKQGRTGVPFVDAAMREMYVTGTMHNRARMIVASYLTKHCLIHWRVGQAWFDECLTDWDPASNALGWQWVAGCGPDAAPYFRIFNPETQAEKFDPEGRYRRRWIAEGQENPPQSALSYFDAIPESWGLSPDDGYPDPVVPLAQGRQRALDAYENRDF